jgi:hypothetical protein
MRDIISKFTNANLKPNLNPYFHPNFESRHAFQRLIRGPFKESVAVREESRIIGMPENLKHAILNLPHAFAPRLDAAIHLRCQFSHFEGLVGPDDGLQ